jgi:hypothetical protein
MEDHMNATYGLTEAKDKEDRDDVSGIVGKLQRLADGHETVQLAAQANRRLRILFVVGSSLPWRAIEFDREVPRRRMMCFRKFAQLQHFVLEQFAWECAYEKFVSEQMATPADLPGITTDWLPSYSFDAVLEAYRHEIGDRSYRSAADRIVNLPHAPGMSA